MTPSKISLQLSELLADRHSPLVQSSWYKMQLCIIIMNTLIFQLNLKIDRNVFFMRPVEQIFPQGETKDPTADMAAKWWLWFYLWCDPVVKG